MLDIIARKDMCIMLAESIVDLDSLSSVEGVVSSADSYDGLV